MLLRAGVLSVREGKSIFGMKEEKEEAHSVGLELKVAV